MKALRLVALAVLGFSSARAEQQTPQQMLEAALTAAERQIQLCQVLQMKGLTDESVWSASTGMWEPTGVQGTFELVFENKPRGRFVIEWQPRIMKWVDGAAPFIAQWVLEYRENPTTVATLKRASQHYDGKRFLPRRLEKNEFHRYTERENEVGWVESFVSGRQFLTEQALRDMGCHGELKSWAKPDRLKVALTAEGNLRIEHAWLEIRFTFSMVLDPKRDFLLVSYERVKDQPETAVPRDYVERYEVSSAVKLESGAWYPTKAASFMEYSPEYAAHLRENDRDNRGRYRADYKNQRFGLELLAVEIPKTCRGNECPPEGLNALFKPKLPENVVRE